MSQHSMNYKERSSCATKLASGFSARSLQRLFAGQLTPFVQTAFTIKFLPPVPLAGYFVHKAKDVVFVTVVHSPDHVPDLRFVNNFACS